MSNTEISTVAVIGAGISGAIAARTLADHGVLVSVFEKSRGTGGRMATRHTEVCDFDHGAQYFTVRDPKFQEFVTSWLEKGIVALWEGEIEVFSEGVSSGPSREVRYVGVPGMNSIAKYLLHEQNIHFESTVNFIEPDAQRWLLRDSNGRELGRFHHVIMAVPAPQAAKLIDSTSNLSFELAQVDYDPCWAVLLRLERSLAVEWNAAFINSGPLRWVARNGKKPGRIPDVESLVLHANSLWSHEKLESSSEAVAADLTEALWKAIGIPPIDVTFQSAHRWRYSIPVNPSICRIRTNLEKSLIACGDWAGGPRIEGAFLSGLAAADIILPNRLARRLES